MKGSQNKKKTLWAIIISVKSRTKQSHQPGIDPPYQILPTSRLHLFYFSPMGICASSKDGAVRKNDNSKDLSRQASTNSIRLQNTGQTMSNLYRTASEVKRTPRASSMKLGFSVPQSLLQRENQEQKRMDDTIRKEILVKFKHDSSGLAGFSKDQLNAVCNAMTMVEVPINEVMCDCVEGIYYVASGTLRNSVFTNTEEMISTGTLFGTESVFAGGKTDTSNKIIATVVSSVWHIHRQLFQAVLIRQTKENDSKRSKVLASIPMLAPLSAAQQRKVAAVMKKVKFSKEEVIIKQGEVGNTMYFIESGDVAIYQTNRGEAEAKEVNRHGAGGFFGEGALVNDGNDGGIRNADCIAKTKTICYAIKRSDFQRLLGPMHELINVKSKARVLKGVKLLETLNDAEREEIARLMKRCSYATGDTIIKQGETGDEFYVIESGEVKFSTIKTEGAAPEDIGTCFQNEFFGEGSLLTENPRRATAIANGETVCYSLSGRSFRLIFGDTLVKDMEATLETRKASDDTPEEKAKSIRIEDINGIRILGEGSYGKVTLVRHSVTGRTYALKQIKKSHVAKMKQEVHIGTELHVLSSVNHPFVCNLVRTFKNQHSVYFMMEAVLGGELYAQMKRVEKFKPSQAQFYAAQVAAVFSHLHSKDIIFRDLKPENLLIASDGYLKMVDFGLAKHVPNGKTYTLCGTPAYASPEVYASVGHDKGVDWWTLGVLIHELLAGYTPFYGTEPNQIYKEITRYSKHFPKVAFPKHFPTEGSNILLGLLHPVPDERLGNLNGGSSDVKNHPYFENVDWIKLQQKAVKPDFVPAISDSYDSGNFKERNDDFERTIESDLPNAKHESWAQKF